MSSTDSAANAAKDTEIDVLQNEVQNLKFENKQLARQLHITRYTAKQNAQKALGDLQALNIQLQKYLATSNSRIRGHGKKMKQCEKEAMKQEQQINEESVDEKVTNARKTLSERQRKLERDNSCWKKEEIAGKEANEAMQKIFDDIENLKVKEKDLLEDLNDSKNLNLKIKQETSQLEDEHIKLEKLCEEKNSMIENFKLQNNEKKNVSIFEKHSLTSTKLSAMRNFLEVGQNDEASNQTEPYTSRLLQSTQIFQTFKKATIHVEELCGSKV
ncbi:unnamed protein product [Clavelina lepadiformis]|uniref:Uncharacterized protein n=1 Tax=Clavelina lepadiformis TaxID=159417 RepID=A0ABP0G3F1_CLALP